MLLYLTVTELLLLCAGQQYVGLAPNPRAPRCLPCGYADPLLGHYHNPLGFNATPVSLLCSFRAESPVGADVILQCFWSVSCTFGSLPHHLTTCLLSQHALVMLLQGIKHSLFRVLLKQVMDLLGQG